MEKKKKIADGGKIVEKRTQTGMWQRHSVTYFFLTFFSVEPSTPDL